jgi:hypothetical protein
LGNPILQGFEAVQATAWASSKQEKIQRHDALNTGFTPFTFAIRAMILYKKVDIGQSDSNLIQGGIQNGK